MPWPDIFWKARKPKPEPISPAAKAAEALKGAEAQKGAEPQKPGDPKPGDPQPPAIKPVPPSASPTAGTPPTAPKSDMSTTRTIPATHGVVLKSPSRVTVTPAPTGPVKNIEQLMSEADPVKTLSQTGSVRLLKRLAPDGSPVPPPAKPQAPTPPPSAATTMALSKPTPASSPWPTFTAKGPNEPKKIELAQLEVKKIAPPSASATAPLPDIKPTVAASPLPIAPASAPAPEIKPEQPKSDAPVIPLPKQDSPFMAKTEEAPPATSAPMKETVPPLIPPSSIARRRATLSDVARIVLPPKREDTGRLPMPAPAASISQTVVPPAFPVTSMTARLSRLAFTGTPAVTTPVSDSPFMERSKPAEPAPMPPPAPVVESKSPEQTTLFADPPKVDSEAHKPAQPDPLAPKTDSAAHDPAPAPAPLLEIKTEPAPAPVVESKAVEMKAESVPVTVESPKVDAPKLEEPKNEPPKPEVSEAKTEFPAPLALAPTPSPERREFHLTNGEHITGAVLRETAEAIYVQHPTLGIVTVPRNEIAKRLVEIILINGDRIVGDILAESADMLYVRHASLGMLSVPRAQRSTRVVEAILKDGDRILGEVLTETDTFTVIKSATLGTVTVPHDKISMLNRKIEQIEMKALPPAPPQLTDKS